MRVKLTKIAVLGLGLVVLPVFAAAAESGLNTEAGKLSYTMGVEIGQNLKAQDVAIEPKLLLQGLEAGLNGKEPALSQSERKEVLAKFQKQLLAKRSAERNQLAQKNLQIGEAFLAKNKTKPGVKILADGLQYKVLQKGTGAKPTASDVVTVNYKGTFINGKVFDSSYKRGKPATFPVADVIAGWQQALKMMKTGATLELYVPAKLAYGKQGMGHLIGPNEALIFKVHLIAIKGKS